MPDDPPSSSHHLKPLAIDPALRLLFIHIRGDERLAHHERTCLLDVLHADPMQATSINIASVNTIAWSTIEAHDAVIIGGSGDHSVVEHYPFTNHLAELVQRIAAERIPLFGSCWGHQFIAKALGGSCIRDREHKEVGPVTVRGTGTASDDEVFGALPESYMVLMGHEDRVDRLPPGAVELAASEMCRNQAFRMEGLPIYGTQFHAELTPERLIERLAAYRHYIPDDREFAKVQAALKPTPHAETVLARFLNAFAVRR
jgi:GMP synthase (glutamine-hydrolysing)